MRVGWLNTRRSGRKPANTVEGARATYDRVTVKVATREFDEIASGARRHIHLPVTRHWSRTLVGKTYKVLVLNRGLLTALQIAIPWPGYKIELVRSGPMAVEAAVYSIDVSGAFAPADAHPGAGRASQGARST